MNTEARFVTRRIAAAIADEQPVDWSPAERALGTDARTLENLRLLDDVARALRSINEQPRQRDTDRALFHWGTLEVVEALGEGHTGEVFRAFDPVLHRDVALKLRARRDPLSDPSNTQLLDEARQLAGIRHRNVLAIYGAAVHDGRAGIWSELIDGRTLAAIVAADGPFGAEEALRIGLDVGRALGVIHAAGVVHGDIKAENVMRERGGRIVLMDFGASGRSADLAARSVVSGTRNYLSPEVLAGAAPDRHSDLYALGVLIHFLLRGEFPRADNGTTIALARRRPDLPAGLCARLDAFVADDAAARPQDAASFARELLALLPEQTAPVSSGRRNTLAWIGGLGVAALVAALIGSHVATPVWQAHAEFVDAATGAVLANGHPVRLGDTLRLRVRGSTDSHVYVLNQDNGGEVGVLFPLAGLDQANPLAGGREHMLPGTVDGRDLAWEIASDAASEEFVVIASADPLPALADRIAQLEAASIGPADQRGATRLRAMPASGRVASADLAALVTLAEQDQADPQRLLVVGLHLPHADR